VATVIELRRIRRLSASPHSPSTYLCTPCPSTNSYCLPGALGLLGSGPDSYKARVLWLPHTTPRELVAYHNPENIAFLLNLATSAPGVALQRVAKRCGIALCAARKTLGLGLAPHLLPGLRSAVSLIHNVHKALVSLLSICRSSIGLRGPGEPTVRPICSSHAFRRCPLASGFLPNLRANCE
jgi:hypothetical protein